ncbi:hypothetical protein ABCR94_38130 [Streptomyces sp. 21So2-11]|uniref:hypothetical protein n=1 Tax=Streptomyces sp. 21So2-11 TaxID=3144408 RepID=UPI00321B1A40
MSAQERPSVPVYTPKTGETVRDASGDKIGVVMGHEGPRWQLRPIGGGKEWDADPKNIQAVDQVENASARVADINRRSGGASDA